MYEFWINTTAGITSGIILAALAWMLARIPNVTGTWTVRVLTQDSANNPYQNLEVTYIAMLSQHGSEVSGIAEKVYERRPDGTEHEYIGATRMRSEITGGLKGNIFQRKEFHLLFREGGQLRDYASIHEIRRVHADMLRGDFTSTAANSHGTTRWVRGIGKYNFNPLQT